MVDKGLNECIMVYPNNRIGSHGKEREIYMCCRGEIYYEVEVVKFHGRQDHISD